MRNINSSVAVAIVADISVGYFDEGQTVLMFVLEVVVKTDIVKNAVCSAFLPNDANRLSSFSESHLQTVISRKNDLLSCLWLLPVILILDNFTAHKCIVCCQIVEGIVVVSCLLKSKVRIDVAFKGVDKERVHIKDVKVFTQN